MKKYVTKNDKIKALEDLVRSHREVIKVLIEEPNSKKATIIKMEYGIKTGFEASLWSGQPGVLDKFEGLIPHINNPKNQIIIGAVEESGTINENDFKKLLLGDFEKSEPLEMKDTHYEGQVDLPNVDIGFIVREETGKLPLLNFKIGLEKDKPPTMADMQHPGTPGCVCDKCLQDDVDRLFNKALSGKGFI